MRHIGIRHPSYIEIRTVWIRSAIVMGGWAQVVKNSPRGHWDRHSMDTRTPWSDADAENCISVVLTLLCRPPTLIYGPLAIPWWVLRHRSHVVKVKGTGRHKMSSAFWTVRGHGRCHATLWHPTWAHRVTICSLYCECSWWFRNRAVRWRWRQCPWRLRG